MATFPGASNDPDRVPTENGVAASFRLGSVWVLVLRGEVDLDCVAPAQNHLTRALREGVPVLFDMSQVSFCDSSALNLLLRARQETAVGLIRPSAWVKRLLDISGIRGLLPAFDTVEDAVHALAAPGGDPPRLPDPAAEHTPAPERSGAGPLPPDAGRARPESSGARGGRRTAPGAASGSAGRKAADSGHDGAPPAGRAPG